MSEAEALASLEKIISKMSRALGEWNDIVNNERNDIMQNALLETCKIVGATCIGINLIKILRMLNLMWLLSMRLGRFKFIMR